MIKKCVVAMSAAVLLAYTALCMAETIGQDKYHHGNGKIIEQIRPLGPFHQLYSQNNLNIQLLKTGKNECSVRADENLLPLIITKVKDDVLYVHVKDDLLINSDHEIVITINTQVLNHISHNGSGDIDGHGIETHGLVLESHGAGDVRLDGDLNIRSIDVSGSGDMQLDNVISSKLDVKIQGESDIEMRGNINLHTLYQSGQGDIIIKGINSKDLEIISQGSGDARLQGEVKSLKLLVNGSADLDASQLITETAVVEVMGSGDIMVNTNKYLSAKVMGSGDVTFYGHPKKVISKVLGSGRIHQH